MFLKKKALHFIQSMIKKKKRFNHGQRKANAKKRNLGYIPLFDNPFPKCDVRSIDMHHVNGIIVIPLPHRTHKKMTDHDSYCKTWIKKLFLLDIDTLLSPELITIQHTDSSAVDDDAVRDYETTSFDTMMLQGSTRAEDSDTALQLYA
jgi:hypothetical protein